MPYNLPLPDEFLAQGWRVKIRDKERAEPPHVSILKRRETWRWGLREKKFLDKKPPARSVPKALVDHLQKNLELLISEWDRMYPYNPVSSEGREE